MRSAPKNSPQVSLDHCISSTCHSEHAASRGRLEEGKLRVTLIKAVVKAARQRTRRRLA